MIPVVIGLSWFFLNRPSVQHALWVVVLLKFVTPPIVSLTVVVPEWIFLSNIASSPQPFSDPEPELVVEGSRVESSLLESYDEIRNDSAAVLESVNNERPIELGRERIEVGTQSIGLLWLIRLAVLTWVTGAIVLAIRHFRCIRQQVRLLSQGAGASLELQAVVTHVAKELGIRPLPIRIVPGIVTPFVWCLGRLKLIWPERIAGEESMRSKRIIIAHELSHVRRRDHWIAWIELVAGLIWWWNPLFWFVCKNIRVNSEMACDALALAQFPEDRGIYAEALFALSVSKTGEPPLVLAVGDGTPSSLERRISMLMFENISGKLSLFGVLVAGLLAAATLPTLSLGQEDSRKANRKAPVSEERSTSIATAVTPEQVTQGEKTAATSQRQLDQQLRIAAKAGDATRMKGLLEQGADPDQFEQGDGLPVIVAAIGSPACVHTLVEHGANLRRRITFTGGGVGVGPWHGIKGEATALHYAVHDGSPETVQYLLNAGMDPNATDIYGQTPLHVAIWTERMARKPKSSINETQIENIKTLLRNDASIWFEDRDGLTAFGIAAKASSPSQVVSLLEARQQQLTIAFKSAGRPLE